MGEITKKDIEAECRSLRATNASLRHEQDITRDRWQQAEERRRAADRRCTILEMRLRDVRSSLDGVEETRGRIRELLGHLEDAKNDLTTRVLLIDLPPNTSGHQSMNDFIAGPVRDGRRDKAARG